MMGLYPEYGQQRWWSMWDKSAPGDLRKTHSQAKQSMQFRLTEFSLSDISDHVLKLELVGALLHLVLYAVSLLYPCVWDQWEAEEKRCSVSTQ